MSEYAGKKSRVETTATAGKPAAAQPGVLIDSFGTGQVDLDDLGHFPAAPSALHPNEMTLGEQIVHILAERRAAQTSTDSTAFAPAPRRASLFSAADPPSRTR